MSAAFINLFDPENPVVAPMRDVFVAVLKKSLSTGHFNEDVWAEENLHYRGPCLTGWNAYPVMILQNSDCLDDALQRMYLNYLWHRQDGIYYLTNFPLSDLPCLEDGRFNAWVYALERLAGFSLFSEVAGAAALPHLLNIADRLMRGAADVPASHKIHYAESWRNGTKRRADMVLRLARLIIRTSGIP